MKHNCFVKDCDGGKTKKVKLYRFPDLVKLKSRKFCQTSKLRRETWIKNIGCEASVVAGKMYICGNHFVHGNKLKTLSMNM